MSIDPVNFVHSLAVNLATALSLVYVAAADAKKDLFRLQGDDLFANDPHSVVAIIPADGTRWEPVPKISVQIMTIGTNGQTVIRRAQALFEAMLADHQPWSNKSISGFKASDNSADGTWKIVSTNLRQRPGLLGADEKRRWLASFNVDFDVVKS